MKKGFTLIEVLAIITLLGALLLLTYPNMAGIAEKEKEKRYNEMLNNLYLSTETYITTKLDNPVYPLHLKISLLEAENLLTDDIYNPRTYEKLDYENNYIEVSRDSQNKRSYKIVENSPSICFTFDAITQTITDYNEVSAECSKDIVIPIQINGVTVLHIGPSAFINSGINSLTIQGNILTVGASSFANNPIRSVTIGNSVTTIGASAFINGDIISLTVPSSVKSIEDSAFRYNDIVTLNLTNGLTTLGSSAFRNNLIQSVYISGNLTTVGTFVFASNQISSVTFDSTVRNIGYGIFWQNRIASLTLPSSLETIDIYAFANNLLTSVVFPTGTRTIGTNSFERNQLTSISIPTTVNSISGGAFNANNLPAGQAIVYARNGDGSQNMANIASYGGTETGTLVIPNGVTTLSNNALQFGLFTGLSLPSTLINIGASAVYGTRITSVTIPGSVTTIGNNAFMNNTSLTSVTFNTGLTTLGNQSFNDTRLVTVSLPSTITSIGSLCFAAVPTLTTVTIARAAGTVTLGTTPFGTVVPTYTG